MSSEPSPRSAFPSANLPLLSSAATRLRHLNNVRHFLCFVRKRPVLVAIEASSPALVAASAQLVMSVYACRSSSDVSAVSMQPAGQAADAWPSRPRAAVSETEDENENIDANRIKPTDKRRAFGSIT